MKNVAKYKIIFLTFLGVMILSVWLSKENFTSSPQTIYASSQIQHIFLIMMENHNWSDIKGRSSAPYINKTLLPMGAHAEQYYNPSGIHPSEPNYIWLEAGSNLGVTNDNPPSTNHQSTTNHLVTFLTKAGLSWKAYQEDISGLNCPLQSSRKFAPKHLGPLFFNDVTNTNNAKSSNCIQHVRPYTELSTDLQKNSIANYNLITPNLCNDMHDCSTKTGDTWLSKEIPKLLQSQAYKNGGAIFITWDEGEGGDGPIGMIVLSPFAKKNYANTIRYDHSSALKTFEEIFDLKPFLGGAAKATDLSNLFTISLTTPVAPTAPKPSTITPTLYCLGSCNASPNPTATTAPSSASSPQPTANVSATPTLTIQNPCSVNAQDATIIALHHDKKHNHSNGNISQFMQFLLQFLQLIINWLSQLLGQGTIPSTPTTSITTPTPCTTQTPTNAIISPATNP